jgi:DNA/RNA-binding domain of Phe-tRNA-synthetase-like protein
VSVPHFSSALRYSALSFQGESTPLAVTPGEYGYVDAADRLLCRLDVRQADFSKVTQRTRNLLLIVEGTAEHEPDVPRRGGGG